MRQLIALCDCNNFFVSCERIHRPDLAGRPVVVLSANDGCIISRSQEVKNLGIKMGEPFYKYKSFLEKQGTAVFSTDFPFYRSVSAKVMAILSQYTDDLEIYSVDEAFMNFSIAMVPNVNEYAAKLKETVYAETKIPISIGIAPTKTLAKLASDYAKKKPETQCVFNLAEQGSLTEFLKNIPAQDIWGIGRRSGDFLRRYGVRTAYDYMALDDLIIKKERGIGGLYTAWELRGIACIRSDKSPGKKSIQVARSFGGALYTEEELRDPVAQFVGMAASEMRRQGSRAGSVRVMVRTDWFKENFYANSEEHILSKPLSGDNELIDVAFALLKSIFKEGAAYKKAGIILGRFSSSVHMQRTLFEDWETEEECEPRKRFLRSVEAINAEMGYRAVRPALYWRAGDEQPRWQPNHRWRVERDMRKESKTGDIPSHSFRVHGLDKARLLGG